MNRTGNALLGASIVIAMASPLAAMAKESSPVGYRFELAGPPKAEGAGKNLVAITLLHDGQPVKAAIVIQSRADMSPINMAAMTAPITYKGEKPPGIYRFEVANGPVWKKPDNWALTFSAKVQGVARTVSGSVTVKLAP